ncbi:MAG: TIGR01212 family radical SAM protein [Ruminococcus flavefaciens]|nr:TIGR01212 family radical SAM protein [Ruminococcus flavefaciens]MCM1230969.1 TIGR01212 family radical SAM protein [Ruminococcus flavefaciens]
MFEFSFDNKRYHTLNYYFIKNFGRKLYKAVIDCGLTCPNIDGTKGRGGCIFCDGGSGYFTNGCLSITGQLESEQERIFRKNGEVSIIAYFQANTNTYAPTDLLRNIYNEALDFPGIAGISIGTRADCLDDDVIDLLCELDSRTNLTVELGMQTVNETTIKLINRCCTHAEFLDGYCRLKEKNIRVCLHIINGLPFETQEMMIETARQTALLRPDGLKIQMLHVIRGTKLAEMYADGSITLMSREEYIDTVVRQLELIPPETVIERITGDGDKNKLIAPDWSRNKIAILGGIDKELAVRDTYQGRLYNI